MLPREGPRSPHSCILDTGSEATGGPHIPFRALTGELSSCNHTVITCHYRGNPAGGPPSQGHPSPRATLAGLRRRHTGAGRVLGLYLSAGER